MEEVENARTKHQIAILGYVLMPSHVHFVLYPPDGLELGRVIGDIKSYSAKRILERWKQVNHPMLPVLRIKRDGWLKYAFWQRRCYDHNCRTIESVREIIRYCHMNPVKAGLVSDASDWIWSSNNWYLNCGEIALEIDGIEL
ncbi:MAG: hypothetical protein GY841_19940 [FCB group bacterium]|nr:hypothetical protein [FCB group bacterium]